MRMKLSFNDLFKNEGNHVTAKKNIRIGALVIPSGHAVNPSDPNLGIPLNEWRDKEFDVDIDNDHIVIQKIT